MKRILMILTAAALLCACTSEKKKLNAYLEKFYPEYEVVGDNVTTDSAFCALNKLEATAIEMIGVNGQLISTYAQNPDSATRLARNLKARYANVSDLAYPKGANNRLAYTVKCKSDDAERLIVFYKQAKDDGIECCSLDDDLFRDSIMSQYDQLTYNIQVILSKQKISEAKEVKDTAEAKDTAEEK